MKLVVSDLQSAIELAPLADSTKEKYSRAITRAVEAGVVLSDASDLYSYVSDLPPSSRSNLKSAIRLWTDGLKRDAQNAATPENIGAVLATKERLEALQDAIKVKQPAGQRFHTWLNQSEVIRMFRTLDGGTIGRRDRAVLGLLVGAGLRRAEAAKIAFCDVMRQGGRSLLSVAGNGAKMRTVPVSEELATALDDWQRQAGPGFIARSVTRGGLIGDSLSTIGIFKIVAKAGERIGKPDLAPHDLRRTYAQLGYEAGVPITQISRLLGHASVATTQRYLNFDLDLETTASDFVPLG